MDIAKQLVNLFSDYGVGNLFYNWSLIDILRIIRNSFLIIANGYSWLLPLLILISLINMVKRGKYSLSILFISFLIPFFLTAKFWYGGLYGRYGSFIGYGLALLIASQPNKFIYWLTIISILTVFFTTWFAYQQNPVPIIQKKIIDQVKLKPSDLLILSDYQRPQLEYINALYVNGNANNQKQIEKKIDQALNNNQRVFISQQAVTFPYWQYDGQQIHIISKGDPNKAVLHNFLTDKNLIEVKFDNRYPLLSLYQIKK